MFPTKTRIVAGMLTLSLVLGGAQVCRGWGIAPRGHSEPRPVDPKQYATGLLADEFDKLRGLIKPKPGGFDDIDWMTDLWEARKKAAAEGKPLLVWVGDGHPLGWT